MSVDAGTIEATLRLKNQFSGDVAAAMAAAAQSVQSLASQVKAANQEFTALKKQANDFGGGPQVQQIFTLPLAEAAAKAKDLKEQLAAATAVLQQLGGGGGSGGGNGGGGAAAAGGFFGAFGQQIVTYAASFVAFRTAVNLARDSYQSIVDLLTSSVDAWAQQELASTRLTAALRVQGTEVPSVVAEYKRLGVEFQNLTMYADRQIDTTEALLAQIGDVMPSDMKRALKATTDLAAGLGIDLETSAKLVGKAFEGNTQTLARYGVVIDQAKVSTEGITYVLDELEKKFGGQAQAQAKTYAGQLQQLKNDFENLEEVIGKNIVQNPLFQSTMTGVRDQLKGADADTVTATHSFSDFIDTVHRWTGAMEGVAPFVKFMESYAAEANAAAEAQKKLADSLPKPEGFKVNVSAGHVGTPDLGTSPDSYNPVGPAQQAAQAAAFTASSWRELMTEGDKVLSVIQDVSLAEDKLSDAQQTAAKFGFQQGLSVDQVKQSMRDMWPEIDKSTIALDKLKKSTDEQTAANKAFQKAEAELDSLGEDWKQTLESIDEWTLNDIKSKLAQGATIQQLAAYYGLMGDQVRAVQKDVEANAKASALAISMYEKQMALAKTVEAGSAKNLGLEGQIELLDRAAELDRARTQLVLEQVANLANETDKIREQAKIEEEFTKREIERDQAKIAMQKELARLRAEELAHILAIAKANAEAHGGSFLLDPSGVKGISSEMDQNPFVQLSRTMHDIDQLMKVFKLAEETVAPLRRKATDDFLVAMGGEIPKIQQLGESAAETAKKLREIAAAAVGHGPDTPNPWSSLNPRAIGVPPIPGGIFDPSGMSAGRGMTNISITVPGISGTWDTEALKTLAAGINQILQRSGRQFPAA